MASYIFVWEQNMYLQKEIGGREWPGHSSMNIGNHFDPKGFTPDHGSAVPVDQQYSGYLAGLSKNYVSYWPATAGANFGLGDLFGKRSKGACKRSVADDIDAEGYLPDWVIKLDTDDNEERLMMAEWATVRDKVCLTVRERVLSRHSVDTETADWLCYSETQASLMPCPPKF